MVAFTRCAGNGATLEGGPAPTTDTTIFNRAAGLRAGSEFLLRHPVVTFLTMGAAFILFGFTSVNLYVLLAANIRLFLDYGLMVVEDGALQQLAELLGLAALSVLFWLLFAFCERLLVRWLLENWKRNRTE